MPLNCSRSVQLAKVVRLTGLAEPVADPMREGVTSVGDPAARPLDWQTNSEIDTAGEIGRRLLCGDDSNCSTLSIRSSVGPWTSLI